MMRLGVTTRLSAPDLTALRFAIGGPLLLPVVLRHGLAVDRLGWWSFAAIVTGAGAPVALLIGILLKRNHRVHLRSLARWRSSRITIPNEKPCSALDLWVIESARTARPDYRGTPSVTSVGVTSRPTGIASASAADSPACGRSSRSARMSRWTSCCCRCCYR